ncbi:putative cysteine synthase b [Golovinomyces cichoracearum]|uniref:Putative cysteine synthase b n=1 Tax=Golovinomyces cichoracearum TaxID=62708 RepID=A0A420IYJ3_9PEZI|nr:putative cysteine synthase b [Golovinomyces cichoracearum]
MEIPRTLFSEPSQPEPDDYRGGIYRAQKLIEDDPSVFNPNQYENKLMDWTSTAKTAPEYERFLCRFGHFRNNEWSGDLFETGATEVYRVGVNNLPCEIVPGTRSVALMEPIRFPWQEAVDTIEEVGSFDAYRLSLALSHEGSICGPSSGLNLQGR